MMDWQIAKNGITNGLILWAVNESFRSVCLTFFFFKSIENIVDMYLLEGTLVTGPFHKN